MKTFRITLAIAASACIVLTALAACHSADKDADDDQPSDFAQKELKKHYENGEINQYQYEQSLKQFTPSDPNAQKPADTSGTSAPVSATGSN